MRNLISFQKMFEYATGEKLKTRWTENDVIIALYYEKFGFSKLGIEDDKIEKFVNEYIGSNEPSLKMEALNIRYALGLKHNEEPEGLSRFSKLHVKVTNEYDSFSEPELREVVENIIDNTTEAQIFKNVSQAENQREEVLKRREAKRKAKEMNPGRRRGRPSASDIEIKNIPVDDSTDSYGRPISKLNDIKSDEQSFVQVGDVLNHKKFGRGEVMSVNGNLIEIDFFENELGTKKLIFKPELFNWTPDSF